MRKRKTTSHDPQLGWGWVVGGGGSNGRGCPKAITTGGLGGGD
jgi:hypothetical protein